jgi:hypothetical protein
VIWLGGRLNETLKHAIEEMKKPHWPLLERIEWR